MRLTNKSVVITGASSGVGKGMVELFVQEGANVVAVARREERLNALVEELKDAPGKIEIFVGDVSQKKVNEQMIDYAIEKFGKLDVLVNNAGIVKDGLLMAMKEEDFSKVVDVNLKGTFHCIHHAARQMIRQRNGRIVNMASVVGVHGNAGQCNYSASKAGMIALAKSIAQEMGAKGIRANAIAPGFIETAMTAALPDDVRAEWCKKIPLRRGGTPEDVANVALFLASDLSSYVSGQVIQIDGGMNM